MNKRDALEKLRECLEDYSTKYMYRFHEKFIIELKDILQKNAVGHEKEVFSLFIKQLEFVHNMGILVNQADGNEILKDTGDRDYYSLHIESKIVNIRMLMTFSENENPLFLAVFFERSGKRVSDYSQWIPVIKKRCEQMEV